MYLLKALENAPYDFMVLCATADEKIPQTLKKTVGADLVRTVPPGRFFCFTGFLKMMKMIRSRKIDTIHVHNLQSAPWTYAAAVLSGCKRIIFTPQVDSVGTGSLEWLFRQLWKIIKPITAMYIAVSKTQHEQMLQWGIASPGKIKTVENHIDESELFEKCGNDRQTVRKNNGLPENAVVVSQMARLDRQKNPFFLMRVAELTRVQAPEMLFVMIGEGPLKRPLEREIEIRNLNGRVRLMGYRPDGLELLNASDIVTLTSRWEGLPYALLEATCFKKPVVVTDIPGNRDLVADGKSGYHAKRPEEFAEKLVKLARSKELRDQMGNHGYRRNKDLFNPGHLARLLREIYDAE
jgi:glycosyltransferase involved in cell wall biosynthesis